jgi:hypothetical protein
VKRHTLQAWTGCARGPLDAWKGDGEGGRRAAGCDSLGRVEKHRQKVGQLDDVGLGRCVERWVRCNGVGRWRANCLLVSWDKRSGNAGRLLNGGARQVRGGQRTGSGSGELWCKTHGESCWDGRAVARCVVACNFCVCLRCFSISLGRHRQLWLKASAGSTDGARRGQWRPTCRRSPQRLSLHIPTCSLARTPAHSKAELAAGPMSLNSPTALSYYYGPASKQPPLPRSRPPDHHQQAHLCTPILPHCPKLLAFPRSPKIATPARLL